MKNDALAAELEVVRDALDAARASVERTLREQLAARGIEVQFLSSRTKSVESLRRKIARPDKTYTQLWDITDLVGLRVAVSFEDTIDDVARLIEDSWSVDFLHSTDKLRFTDHGRFGYRSLHYICAFPRDAGLSSGAGPAPRFEIQVRTVLQHAWAEVEHDLGYKVSESVPEVIRRRFSRIASLLEIADQEFVSIRRDLATLKEQARAELLHPSRPLPLDVVTLGVVVECDAGRALDVAVARALAKPLTDAPFFPEYLVRMLRQVGLHSTRDVQDAVIRHADDALRIVAPYFAFAAETWGMDARSLDVVQPGYGLFFLAHVVILRGSDLGISKVAKLAQLYQLLDYPNDERTAQRVASALAAALAPALTGA